MKLIVGLGNPGEKYRNNRHNVGFMMVDFLYKKVEGGGWKVDKYNEAEIAEVEVNNEKIILAKPTTFMNDSGRSIKKLSKVYDLKSNNLIVVHDDLDIRLGEYKIQVGKGPKLHNGIESIENEIGSKDFTRVRIGVDNRDDANRIPGEAYVLQNFNLSELAALRNVFEDVAGEFLI